MNNDVYGKAMETSRKRMNLKLANNEKDYLECTSNPSFKLHKKFGNRLVAIIKSKLPLKLKNQHTLECEY